MRTLTVITAGLSNPSSTRSVADKISAAVNTAVTARGEALTIEVIEVKNLAVDLAHAMTAGGLSSESLSTAKQQVSDSDGLIVVTPIFKASYTGLLKMFFDVLDTDALNGMPTIIAATAGTARHSLVLDFALRPLLTYMRAVVVPTGIFAATEDFGSSAGSSLESRVNRAAGELADLLVQQSGSVGGLGGPTAGAETGHRRRKTGNDPAENFTPFAQLLEGYDGSA